MEGGVHTFSQINKTGKTKVFCGKFEKEIDLI